MNNRERQAEGSTSTACMTQQLDRAPQAGANTPSPVMWQARSVRGQPMIGSLAGVLRVQQLKGNRAVSQMFVVQQSAETQGTVAEPNYKGLPANLKAGIESLSGLSMDEVRVHYNSSRPAQLNALAYTQGTEIHIAPGQERHLPHEAWHVVQQAQGRVKPTMQMKGGVPVNDDKGLEREADVMGQRATLEANQHLAASNHSGDGSLKPHSHADPVLEAEADRAGERAVVGEPAIVTGRASGWSIQRLVAPPIAPPVNGVRGGALNGAGAPTESHVTTPIGGNDLVGTPPDGVVIFGWPYVQSRNATGAWVRFHLVNQQIGGLGNQNNLVPTSHATNHQAGWRAFERDCKDANALNQAIHVSVAVTYPVPAIPPVVAGSLDANKHFYPNTITAACHLWDPTQFTWVRVSAANIVPFPLQPPASATKKDLTQQTPYWLQNTLMGGQITKSQSETFQRGLNVNYMGPKVQNYFAISLEPTDEMKLLDALETFVAVDLAVDVRLTDEARLLVYNGVYHI